MLYQPSYFSSTAGWVQVLNAQTLISREEPLGNSQGSRMFHQQDAQIQLTWSPRQVNTASKKNLLHLEWDLNPQPSAFITEVYMYVYVCVCVCMCTCVMIEVVDTQEYQCLWQSLLQVQLRCTCCGLPSGWLPGDNLAVSVWGDVGCSDPRSKLHHQPLKDLHPLPVSTAPRSPTTVLSKCKHFVAGSSVFCWWLHNSF